MNIAVIGASKDRSKFGNKCVRAYKSKNHKVFPVNPKEAEIEGLKCYKSIKEIKEKLDIVSLYLPPKIGESVVDEIIKVKPKKVYLNPGTESEVIVRKLLDAGIEIKQECSIVALGLSPALF